MKLHNIAHIFTNRLSFLIEWLRSIEILTQWSVDIIFYTYILLDPGISFRFVNLAKVT